MSNPIKLDQQSQGLLSAVAAMPGEPTGSDTLDRYHWQTKQTVRLWLECLSTADDIICLVCEHLEDLAIVYTNRLRFLQLKTRDRGSWSAAKMCDEGCESLIRTYKLCREKGVHEQAQFELWLEGPISGAKETVDFVKSPSAATQSIRKKLLRLGANAAWLDDFLLRLRVHPDQPPRAYIDSKVTCELGALWTSMSVAELRQIYERLLNKAAAAQVGGEAGTSVEGHLKASATNHAVELAIAAQARAQIATTTSHDNMLNVDEEGSEHAIPAMRSPLPAELEALAPRLLDREVLIDLTPPVSSETDRELVHRIAKGEVASQLELKLRRSGAKPDTIRKVQSMRAQMEVRRQILLASRESAEADLERLAERVLLIADASATKVKLDAASNSAAASAPAEYIVADLTGRLADLAHCDAPPLFDGDGFMILGYLGHLSDLCRFPWRAK